MIQDKLQEIVDHIEDMLSGGQKLSVEFVLRETLLDLRALTKVVMEVSEIANEAVGANE